MKKGEWNDFSSKYIPRAIIFNNTSQDIHLYFMPFLVNFSFNGRTAAAVAAAGGGRSAVTDCTPAPAWRKVCQIAITLKLQNNLHVF